MYTTVAPLLDATNSNLTNSHNSVGAGLLSSQKSGRLLSSAFQIPSGPEQELR